MERIPIVIDTDPGIDDFFCLALACAYSDRLDLRAVTTMGGNNHTDVTTQNALNILSLFRTDVPVARGADRYLEAEFGAPAAKCHGVNGVGNLVLPQSDRTPDDLPAWDKLYEIAKAAQGELVLVTVAPLTNIALALQKHPDLPHWIKKIVMMGGSIGRGNITPYVEANAGHDPAAEHHARLPHPAGCVRALYPGAAGRLSGDHGGAHPLPQRRGYARCRRHLHTAGRPADDVADR